MIAPDRTLLSGLAAETADLRARLDEVGDLFGALVRGLPDAQRLAALAPAQTFDLMGQRLDALTMVLDGLSSGRDPADLIAAITLSDMTARLRADPAASPVPVASGDVVLFE